MRAIVGAATNFECSVCRGPAELIPQLEIAESEERDDEEVKHVNITAIAMVRCQRCGQSHIEETSVIWKQ